MDLGEQRRLARAQRGNFTVSRYDKNEWNNSPESGVLNQTVSPVKVFVCGDTQMGLSAFVQAPTNTVIRLAQEILNPN